MAYVLTLAAVGVLLLFLRAPLADGLGVLRFRARWRLIERELRRESRSPTAGDEDSLVLLIALFIAAAFIGYAHAVTP